MKKIDYILDIARENGFKASELELISNANKMLTNYSDHAINVAVTVTELNTDCTAIVGALLHEEVQMDRISLDKISESFGESVSMLISNFIKMDNIKLNDYNESSSIYLRKVLVGISEDVRVLILKLADRLDELENALELSSDEQKRLVNGTMNVLVPIAHRLGINSIKSKLEDLCLKISKRDVYDEILEKLDGTREELSQSLEEMKGNIVDILTEHGISFSIKSRVKSVYSIYNKLSTGRKWSDIYDILAMRIIVSTKDECYQAVGLIHSKYRPIPKRFKDFIATPKENMYQSLHTSVFGIDGYVFEIQIRTAEMNEIAEHGIASHWSYKEHGTIVAQNLMEQKLEVFRNTINLSNNGTYKESMEDEILSQLIYIYTPKGDVVELPNGATPIDFAYRIHSGVGDKTVGAIVNNQIVPLNYELQDGDIVKINTNSSSKPNKEWLKFAKTAQAKSKIKSYFSKIDREKYILTGKELLEKEIKKQHLEIGDILSDNNINTILTTLKVDFIDDVYFSIGSFRYTPTYIINIVNEEKKNIKDIMFDRVNRGLSKKNDNYKNDIIVAGTDNILVSLAKCCNPIPGDNIIGYVTKGEGVLVHKDTCFNIKNESNRLIDVKWNDSIEMKLFTTNLVIKTNSKDNHLLDIVTCASTKGASILSVKQLEVSDGINYQISVNIKNKDDLSLFIDSINSLDYVLEVLR